MAWKNGEFGFHGVEDSAERRLPLRGDGGEMDFELMQRTLGLKGEER